MADAGDGSSGQVDPEVTSSSGWNDFGSVALQRFMVRLLDEAAVTALHTFLIQDNASILTKAASRSAHAAHRRFLVGKDHLITKEISRWESYPFEVDQRIAFNKSKEAKNGCVSEPKAKRRSGLESAGEIKADILKKAESLPRPPRRRSSIKTDDVKKMFAPDELLASFEKGGNNHEDTHRLGGKFNNAQPKRELSPRRATPKKPVRRESKVPLDMYLSPQACTMTSGRDSQSIGGDSQHSSASESTLSELGGGRQSDLSSVISESSDLLSAMESRSIDCAVIMEEDEEEEEPSEHLSPQQKQRSSLIPNNSSESLPKKPIRCVNEFPEDLADPSETVSSTERDNSASSSAIENAETVSPPEAEEQIPLRSSNQSNDKGIAPKMTAFLPPKMSSMPKKPVRRVSELHHDLVSDADIHNDKQIDTLVKPDGTHYSPSTDSMTSDTEDEDRSGNCSLIREEEEEEESSSSLHHAREEDLPFLLDHSGKEPLADSVTSIHSYSMSEEGSDFSFHRATDQEPRGDGLPQAGCLSKGASAC